MTGGVIKTKSVTADVAFVSNEGKEVLPQSKGVEVKIIEEFSGRTIPEALEEAKKYAVGAIQKKVAQKTRGFFCRSVVKNLDVKYTVKYGFK